MSHTFASDNFAVVHPEVMMVLQKAKEGHEMAYGVDSWIERSNELLDLFQN